MGEWTLVILSVLGTVAVTARKRVGFYLWTASNAGWIHWTLQAGHKGQAALFTVYLALSIWGIWAWRK